MEVVCVFVQRLLNISLLKINPIDIDEPGVHLVVSVSFMIDNNIVATWPFGIIITLYHQRSGWAAVGVV